MLNTEYINVFHHIYNEVNTKFISYISITDFTDDGSLLFLHNQMNYGIKELFIQLQQKYFKELKRRGVLEHKINNFNY